MQQPRSDADLKPSSDEKGDTDGGTDFISPDPEDTEDDSESRASGADADP
ncbi:hypothetical protein [Antrihabitans sp. YC2-6]|nr:hypothetical protein [Antrihabitans sp. YC2-6]MBJ8345788.1 hypothetical protein [Antrihabitans sp. YC2-6]